MQPARNRLDSWLLLVKEEYCSAEPCGSRCCSEFARPSFCSCCSAGSVNMAATPASPPRITESSNFSPRSAVMPTKTSGCCHHRELTCSPLLPTPAWQQVYSSRQQQQQRTNIVHHVSCNKGDRVTNEHGRPERGRDDDALQRAATLGPAHGMLRPAARQLLVARPSFFSQCLEHTKTGTPGTHQDWKPHSAVDICRAVSLLASTK
jgi:hypothetical protein